LDDAFDEEENQATRAIHAEFLTFLQPPALKAARKYRKRLGEALLA
jgi:hypothetical protein